MDKAAVLALADKAGWFEPADDDDSAFLLRFAALVSQAAREQCAKICEQLPPTELARFAANEWDAVALALNLAAAAIRGGAASDDEAEEGD